MSLTGRPISTALLHPEENFSRCHLNYSADSLRATFPKANTHSLRFLTTMLEDENTHRRTNSFTFTLMDNLELPVSLPSTQYHNNVTVYVNVPTGLCVAPCTVLAHLDRMHFHWLSFQQLQLVYFLLHSQIGLYAAMELSEPNSSRFTPNASKIKHKSNIVITDGELSVWKLIHEVHIASVLDLGRTTFWLMDCASTLVHPFTSSNFLTLNTLRLVL